MDRQVRTNAVAGVRRLLLGAAALIWIGSCDDKSSKPPSSAPSELYPDLSVAVYRYADQPAAPAGPSTQQAIEALERRVAEGPPSPIDLADLADVYFRSGMETGSIEAFDKARDRARLSLELLPAPNAAIMTLAKLANASHDFRRSIDLSRRGLSQGAGASAWTLIANSHLALGELDQAAEAARAAVAKQPSTATHLTLALVLEAGGHDRKAARAFAMAARSEQPGDRDQSARLRALWGRFLMRRGEMAGAELLYKEALDIVPDFPLAVALSGELALRRGHPVEARDLFEKAFASSREVRYLLDEARARQLAGDNAGADAVRSQVERIVRADLAQGDFGHRLDLVEVLLDRGQADDLDEAIAVARQELEHRPSPAVRYQLARGLLRAAQLPEAMMHIHAAIESGTREAQYYQLAEEIESRAGNRARAHAYRMMVERLDPGPGRWRSVSL